MRRELSGTKQSALTREISVGKEFNALHYPSQKSRRNDVRNGTIVARNGDKSACFGGTNC